MPENPALLLSKKVSVLNLLREENKLYAEVAEPYSKFKFSSCATVDRKGKFVLVFQRSQPQ